MTHTRHPEEQYLDLLRELIAKSERAAAARPDRTGTGTISVLGRELRFDLAQGFPAFTTKKIFYRHSWKEILWMLRGGTNIRELLLGSPKVTIWSDWPLKAYNQQTGSSISQELFERWVMEDEMFALSWGDLGPVYGKQWRAWKAADGRLIDQVAQVIETLKTNPTSRRNFWSGWNVGEIEEMSKTGLPPCHVNYFWYVEDNRLSLQIWQRSADALLGIPFNVCAGALLVHLFADHVGMEPGELVWYGADTHLYWNHLDQARIQIARAPRPLPTFVLKNPRDKVWDYVVEDVELDNYDPHPAIKAAVAV